MVHNESIDRDLVQRDQLQGDQYNAPATVTHAQTVNCVYTASEPKRQRILSTTAPPPQGVGVMGRDEELAELDARVGEPGNNLRLLVHGESGVGKSELLREYARRHEAGYPAGRYWIDCRLNLAQELASLGRQGLQMAWLEGPLEEQAIEVLQHLAKEKVWLLLDNASQEAQVEPFLPPAGQAHVLLSSTSRDWGPPLVEVWRPDGLQRLDAPWPWLLCRESPVRRWPWKRRPNAWRRHPPMGSYSRLCSATSWELGLPAAAPRWTERRRVPSHWRRALCFGAVFRGEPLV